MMLRENFNLHSQIEAEPSKILNDRKLLIEQYKNSEKVDIDGEKLEIYDLNPEIKKTDVPLVVVPGWSATPKVMEENMLT